MFLGFFFKPEIKLFPELQVHLFLKLSLKTQKKLSLLLNSSQQR